MPRLWLRAGQLTAGMCPCNSVMTAIAQILLMSPLRVVALAYLKHFDGIILKCAERKAAGVDGEDPKQK